MGKILKFCNSCEEGFAERFTFCPDCGGSLQAVELNPVEPVAAVQPEPVVAAIEETFTVTLSTAEIMKMRSIATVRTVLTGKGVSI